ncbi:MAG: DUF433 domain-containing protein [Pirellulales bacterium]|nr:DUF433 domain-containing protein [Pirellulales bacterium]
MSATITTNPHVMHGTPCFAGTRVAVRTLFDHLEGGSSIDEFLTDFPTVGREQVMALLDHLRREAEHMAVVDAP